MKSLIVLSLFFAANASFAQVRIVQMGALKSVDPIEADYAISDRGEAKDYGGGHVLYSVRFQINPHRSGFLGLSKPRGMIGNSFGFEGRVPGSTDICQKKSDESYDCSSVFAVEGSKLYLQVQGSAGGSNLYVVGSVGPDDRVTFVPAVTPRPVKLNYEHGDRVDFSLTVNGDLEPLFPEDTSIRSRLPADYVCDIDHLSAHYDYVARLSSGQVYARAQVTFEVTGRDGDQAVIHARRAYTEEMGQPSSRAEEGESKMTASQLCPSFGLHNVRNCAGIQGQPEKIGDIDTCRFENPDHSQTIWFAEDPFAMAKFIESTPDQTQEYTYVGGALDPH
jgi:hypothetical protein